MTSFPQAVLLVRGGPEDGQSIPLSEGVTMLGRASVNDVVVETPGGSRQHAGVRGGTEGYWIADLGSKNGTFVNGVRVGAEPERLKNFDRIELGGTGMEVHWVFMEAEATMEMPPMGAE